MKELKSERVTAVGFTRLMEMCWEKGWTDGNPVVPPTEERVREFIDYVGLEPDHVIGAAPERDRIFTVEKAAINAVMAGCKPEYMPVVIAAIEAICDPEFKFNHLAGLGSPFPLFIVNGPIAKQLKIHHGMYLFGAAGHRANATIGRAVSLFLWNCAEARPDGIQRGQWGNPIRSMCVIAENEDETPWDPLHVQLGYRRDESTVTALSQTPPSPMTIYMNATEAEWMCQVLARTISERSDFRKGTYLVIIAPAFAHEFAKAGWSIEDIRQGLVENCWRSMADLKRRARWGRGAIFAPGFAGNPATIEPGEEEQRVYLFKNQPEVNDVLFGPSELERKIGIYVMVGGGDAGTMCAFVQPYGASTNPTTRRITARQ